MKRGLYIFAILLSALIVGYIYMVFSTDNQIRNYVYSRIKPDQHLNYPKVEKINVDRFEQIIKSNPNTQLYFLTYYCFPCCKKLMQGKPFDSVKKQPIIFFTVDNLNAIKGISELINKNPNIDIIYYLDDNHFKGMYHIKGNNILKKYCPVNYDENSYPFILITDSLGVIRYYE